MDHGHIKSALMVHQKSVLKKPEANTKHLPSNRLMMNPKTANGVIANQEKTASNRANSPNIVTQETKQKAANGATNLTVTRLTKTRNAQTGKAQTGNAKTRDAANAPGTKADKTIVAINAVMKNQEPVGKRLTSQDQTGQAAKTLSVFQVAVIDQGLESLVQTNPIAVAKPKRRAETDHRGGMSPLSHPALVSAT